MRIVVVGMLIAVIPLQAFAAASKKPVATKQSMTPAPRKADPCKQYGAGFVQVEGTSTCIRSAGASALVGVFRTRAWIAADCWLPQTFLSSSTGALGGS